MQEAVPRARWRRLAGLARLLRFRTTLSAPAITLIGWSQIDYHILTVNIPRVACSAFSSFAVMAFAQVFNDIRDADLDALVKPSRPIPAREISVVEARLIAAFLATVGIVAAIGAGRTTALDAVCCIVLAALYSIRLKNTILCGNLTVALVSCAMLTYGSMAVASPKALQIVGTVLIFLYGLGNEFYKTAVDASGDSMLGIRTISTMRGYRTTAVAISIVSVALILLILISYLAGPVKIFFVIVALAGVGLPVLASTACTSLRRDVTLRSLIRGHALWRSGWTPGILALLLLR